MSLPPIGAQGAPPTPPLPQDDTGLPPPPPRLEQTPNELLWMIAQAIQRQNRDTPPLDTVLELPRLNSRFAAVFGQPAAASRAMHALALAQTPGELMAAIDALADLPRPAPPRAGRPPGRVWTGSGRTTPTG
ncbi:hypothetical protein GT347_15790 [Xylophilus rhododendri]|uniref:Uncharacterized protein n=1 Tax=Xylophilus rhododendri TaxID=2697032 RepID=A0A857J990_9BURK|nr:hypothetical protein [Xylophilus rhododendri]QHI99308.1 hypothetical protein GT347_15790 [Xylophilus rhododendri]